MYRNLTHALVGSLKQLTAEGAKVPSRNGHTLELYAHQMKIERPLERVLITPSRGNNPFAALAETLWVIGGRDDMEYLSRYLPRATDFSDDGKVWRGAYGPRLRSWLTSPENAIYSTTNPNVTTAIDQVEQCVRILCEDLASRRAVMVIFDPGQDFIASKDIPCNNWLHFLVRDGKLNLTVGVRSNDAIWGFSGINLYEWSVLQQMMAHWIGAEVGIIAYTASSFHLYDYHFEMAEKVIAGAKAKTLYDFGFTGPKFSVGWEDFGEAMDEFYEIENDIWLEAPGIDDRITMVADDFLRTALQMIRVYQAFKTGDTTDHIAFLVNRMPSCDLRVAAIEYLSKQKRQRVVEGAGAVSLKDEGFFKMVVFPEEREQGFFDYLWTKPSRDVTIPEIVAVLKVLHEKKSRAYGDSWKKHGEVLGVFSNITRKRDRIISLQNGAKATADEGMFDTIADLTVYAAKYLTLLSELYPDAFEAFIRVFSSKGSFPLDARDYNKNEGFDKVVDMLLVTWGNLVVEVDSFEKAIEIIEIFYRELEVVLMPAVRTEKGEKVIPASAALCVVGLMAMQFLISENPQRWEAFAASVEVL